MDKSREIANALVSELDCSKFNSEYKNCVDKHWKHKSSCDEQLKRLQVCMMKYFNR